jgi:RNA polymerase sigma-70 factor (ECF subfamily)
LKDEARPASRLPERIRGGDREDAYREVVEETKDSLFRFLLHLLRDEDAAREVFQDTYIRVFRALEGFRGDSSITTWVLTIGRNVALNRIRQRKTREDRTRSLDDFEEGAPSIAVTDPEEPVMTRSLVAALGELPEAQREAVMLYYVEDQPLAEVARLTGRTVNTVKSDLLRARKRLRQTLEDPA